MYMYIYIYIQALICINIYSNTRVCSVTSEPSQSSSRHVLTYND